MTTKNNDNLTINYTNSSFPSIKKDLIEYARRYYPDTVTNFEQGTFNSLFMDSVAYVGDVLSFYLDYQANESFFATAVDEKNLVRHAIALNYPLPVRGGAFGQIAIFVEVPATAAGGLASQLIPILRRGTTLSTDVGVSLTLAEDVDFRKQNVTSVVSKNNSVTGAPTSYALKAYGTVVTGVPIRREFSVGAKQKFLRIELPEGNRVTEVLSVSDTEGNEYFQVDHLSQNRIFKKVLNKQSTKETVPYILKPVVVPRRYTIERQFASAYLRFGAGSDNKISDEQINEPRNVVLKMEGRDYISSTTFDPSKLIETDKMGIAPENTTLSVLYRTNDVFSNVAAGVSCAIGALAIEYPDINDPNNPSQRTVAGSIEGVVESPIIGDTSLESIQDVKKRALANYAAQDRAVTRQDYIALIYRMDPAFGKIKRCNVLRDYDSNRRNINIYTVSEDVNGKLTAPSAVLKNNLKAWLMDYKMINDTVDILNGNIINIGINYSIIVDMNYNRYDVLATANAELSGFFGEKKYDFGESFFFSDIYKQLKDIDGLLDVVEISVVNLNGGNYSESFLDIEQSMSSDGRMLLLPHDSVLEVKFPTTDIRGSVV